jgi:D-alanine-D-alanine ligase
LKKALIIHQHLPENAPPDEMDVLEQALAIQNSILEFGYESKLFQVTLNLGELYDEILHHQPDVVFNLVETLNGHGRLIHLVAALLESMYIPFTGCGQHALNITTGKVIAKEEMLRFGIPTASFFTSDQVTKLANGKKYILKPEWEDASVGITDEKVVTTENASRILFKANQTGIRDWFFEEYIDGREFNVTMLEGKQGWKIFSPAEILFVDYPDDKPKILGYESKWAGESFEYNNTPRTFEIAKNDQDLICHLKEISKKCIDVFKLRGYARVDFRVDHKNNPFVLEVNANPCISPDAGFYAACSNEGLTYSDIIRNIIDSAFK